VSSLLVFRLQVFRVDLNSADLTPELFAVVPPTEVGGFSDLVFADDGTLLVMSFHSQVIFQFSAAGEFIKKIKVSLLERPIGITFRENKVWIFCSFSVLHFPGSVAS